MLRRVATIAALLAVVAVPAVGTNATAKVRCDWPMFGHDTGRSFATPAGCSTMTPTSAPTLAPKWFVPTKDEVSASPAIVDGKVYIGDWAGNFYRLDAETGAIDWTFVVDDTSDIGFGRIVSSAAYTKIGDTPVVLFGGGATLYALDARDGTRLDSVCVDPRDVADRCHTAGDEVEIESSPAVVQEPGRTSVLVGMDVHNGRNVGRAGVIKFSLSSHDGKVHLDPVWKFDPEALDGAAYSSPDMLTVGSGTGTGCADVWGSPAVDVRQRLVFFGTGSCEDKVAAAATGEHVFAVALGDGHRVWSYRAHDDVTGLVDDDFGGALNLLPGGLVGAGSKDGWYYALERQPDANGNAVLKWKTQVGQPGHASAGFAVGGILASAAVGEVDGRPAIFAATAISTPNDKPLESGPDTAPPTVLQDPQRMFSLHAIDAATGAILWRSPVARQAYGPPTFVNGVVLVPCTFDFQVDAFDADTGLPLAARPMTAPPSSAPTAMGDSVYGGVGTSTGEGSPLAPLGGVYALRVIGL